MKHRLESGPITSWQIEEEKVEAVTDFIFLGSKISDSWTIKKAERQRIDAFKLWCWRRLLRDPWTARRSNQSILKKIKPEYLLEDWCGSWRSSTLVTWCKELTLWKRPWCWERLKAWREGGNRGWAGWMTSSTQWTWVWANSWRQWGFPGGSVVKNPPVNAGDTEIRALSLGQEDHLEEEVATHSSILAWKILWTEEPGRLQSMWLQSQTWLSNWMQHSYRSQGY